MISENAKDYLQADPLKNKNARKFQLSLTQRMVDILDGKEGYTPFGTEIATKNYWGKYNDNEINNITNELVKKTLSGNSTSPTNSENISPSESSHYVYNWNSGTDYSLLPPTSSTREKINLFANDLLKTINNLQSAQTSGKVIHGYEGDLSTLEDKKQKLTQLINNTEADDNKSFLSLLSIIQDGNLGVDPDTFKSVFKEFYGEKKEPENGDENSEKSIIYRDQALTDYLTGKGLHLLKTDDGKILLSDASGQRAASNFVELDPTSPYYQWGFFIDPNTGEILGADNLAQNNEFTDKFAEQFNALIPKIKEEQKRKFPIQDYTQYGGKKGIDFSNYFEGNNVIFVDPKDFNFDENLWIPYQDWFENWNDIKSNFKYNGFADITNGNTENNQYAKSIGWIESDLTNIPDLSDSQILQMLDGTGNHDDVRDINGSSGFWKRDKSFRHLLANDDPNISISDRLVTFINLYLKAEEQLKENPNKTDFEIDQEFKNFAEETPDNIELGDKAMDQIRSNSDLYKQILKYVIQRVSIPEDRTRIIKELNRIVEKKKLGGIIKAFHGSKLNQSDIQTTTGKTITPEEPLDSDAELGLGLALGAAVLDLGLVFDPEPWSSGIGSAIVLGLNQAADHYLDVSTGQKWLDGGVDAVAGVASVVPLLGNATQYAKVGYKAAKLGKLFGRLGSAAGGILTAWGIKSAADQQLFSKFLTNPTSLSKEEATTLVRLVTNSAGFARSIQGIKRANRGIFTKTDTPEFIQVKDASGNISY